MKVPSLFFVTLVLLLLGCKEETNIGNLKNNQLKFEALPDTIKKIYESEALNKNPKQDNLVISTDTLFKIHHKHTGMDNDLIVLLTKGFNHHFEINKKKFVLQANQGDPFILHDKQFYYTLELNLADYNYKEAQYISVDLSDFID